MEESVRLNPRTGKPVNINHNWYGRKKSSATRATLRHTSSNNTVITNKKPCYLKHMKTGTIIQFDCVFDVCAFLCIDKHSSSKGAMIKRGYHKEWYFLYGTFAQSVIQIPQVS